MWPALSSFILMMMMMVGFGKDRIFRGEEESEWTKSVYVQMREREGREEMLLKEIVQLRERTARLGFGTCFWGFDYLNHDL